MKENATQAAPQFTDGFGKYACVGDSVTTTLEDGSVATATSNDDGNDYFLEVANDLLTEYMPA